MMNFRLIILSSEEMVFLRTALEDWLYEHDQDGSKTMQIAAMMGLIRTLDGGSELHWPELDAMVNEAIRRGMDAAAKEGNDTPK